MGPQVVEFKVDGDTISVSPHDAERIIRALRARGQACLDITKRIEEATQLQADTTRVELRIGEDECVLSALDELRPTGNYLQALERLEHAFRKRIE